MKAHHWAIYFITLIVDYSPYGYVYLLSHLYEAVTPDFSNSESTTQNDTLEFYYIDSTELIVK